MNEFCSTNLAGIPLGCDAALGGIKEVYVVPYTNLVNADSGEEDITQALSLREACTFTDETISKIFVGGSMAGKAFKYRFKRETGNFETAINKEENGAIFYESTVNLVFGKQEVSKKIEVEELAKGDLAMFIKDNNNKVWALGLDYPVKLSEGSVETGTSFGDFNGYNLTFADFSRDMPYEVTGAALIELNNI